MSKSRWRDIFDDDDDSQQPEPTPVPDLPWYNTLRAILEPYQPAKDLKDSDQTFSSAEIIASIEQHHGIPQGLVKGDTVKFVFTDDFVRAMNYCGYNEVNAGGVGLQWIMKRK